MRSLVLLLVLLPGIASANAARRSHGGQAAGEPGGSIDVAIESEVLTVDLRAVSEGGWVQVDAVYHLDNSGEAKKLDLIFASGAESLRGFRVAIDGVDVPSTLVSAKLPDSWQPPTSTPLPGGGSVGFDIERDVGAATFDLVVPPGKHRLAIGYGASPSRHFAGEPMILYQFAYVLAPARSWASFGKLTIIVHVPPGWAAAALPELDRDGDKLMKTFTGIPADNLGITVHSPAGHYGLFRILGLVGFGLALLGGGGLLWRVAKLRARRRAEQSKLGGDTIFAMATAIVWATAIIASGWFAIFGPDMALVPGEVDHRGYGDGFAMIGVVLLGLIALGLGTGLGRMASRRGVADATG